ncbi:uncharacterized protein B0T15DRAFT_536617 [Chaetomium strumarium]|uniref:RNA polymerase II assembly factor Rtp1 C-terminal domain-containing protein n=1 Tax=Chaetomium strumarium TaxID=1170767 RepID=A0AAJ0M0H5_9PEZI|nr:hypothetical protein B0T15DRAFT_536617 [Chaetomium strumarium]
MDQNASETSGRQKLMQSIIDAGTKAFSPDVPESLRAQATREFDELIQRTKTLNVLGALNILVRPGHVPPWLRSKLMEELTRVPLRPDGVRATLEFVFSVHPSSTVRVSEAAVPQKKGANITHEALTLASNLLSAPPASVAPETWYSAISPQLLVLLDGGEGPELVKVASYVVGFGILGRKAAGAPGTAGWKYFAEPMLNHIKPPPGFSNEAGTERDGIVDLTKQEILVQHNELLTALRRLHALLVSHPNPGLCKRLLAPLVLPLWALASRPEAPPAVAEPVCSSALELLKTYSMLMPSPGLVLLLARNLGYIGGHNTSSPEWVYQAAEDGHVQIVDARPLLTNKSDQAFRFTLEHIDRKTAKLLDLVTSTLSDADISASFLELLKRWLASNHNPDRSGIIVQQDNDEEEDSVAKLAEVKTLQAMMERFPEKLATQPKHILDLVSQIIARAGNSPDGDDEVAGVALSLLNMVVTVPGFQKSRVEPAVLSLIESSLDRLSNGSTDLSRTANNLRLLLLYRDEIDSASSVTSTSLPTDQQVEDRKTYALAISYITQPDSPAPVRSEGLNLIATLITSQSPVLDIPGILVLLSSLISDADEYIYLRIIKLYALLANNHPRSVTRELTDHFVDAKEAHPLDARLRFGEALVQVIQRLGQTFTGALAAGVGNALLSVAGRRGRRPKTEAKQLREQRLQAQRNREAAEAWGGEVPDMSDPMTEEERARKELLERIVDGWDESKRGMEDVRVRASALSVLGAAVEVNAAGLGQGLVTGAVDLCVAVLQLERGLEKGILRRAAVLFVMSFVKALEEAREKGRALGLGFGKEAQEDVMRTLRYVAETDNDGLVVQHAKDVVESLETWQVVKLLPASSSQQPPLGEALTKLTGLEVDPERSAALHENRPSRPRIEEVE